MIQSIAQQAETIRAALEAYARPLGGRAEVIANIAHLWEMVRHLDNHPALVLVCNGELTRGGAVRHKTPRADRQWAVVILRGHGWQRALHAGDTGPTETPLFTVAEEVRDLLRVQFQITEEPPVDYAGFKAVPNLGPDRAANVFLDAFQIDFATANDLPALDSPDGLSTLSLDSSRYVLGNVLLPAGADRGTVSGLHLAFTPGSVSPVVMGVAGGPPLTCTPEPESFSSEGFAYTLSSNPPVEGYLLLFIVTP